MAFWIPRASRSVVHHPHRHQQLGDRVRPAALPGLPDSAERASRAQLCVGDNGCKAGVNGAALSPPETDPQILERWGYAHEVHLGKYIRAKDFGLEFWYDVQ